MLVQSLKKHFPARVTEWLNGGMLLSWGIYVVLHPDLWTNSATKEIFAEMARVTWGTHYPPFALWGLSAIAVGGTRLFALFINGAYSRTPAIRLCTSFASAFVWTQVVVSLMRTGVPNTGIIVYSWLVFADILSAYRAGIDVAVAERQRCLDMELGSGVSNVHSLAA